MDGMEAMIPQFQGVVYFIVNGVLSFLFRLGNLFPSPSDLRTGDDLLFLYKKSLTNLGIRDASIGCSMLYSDKFSLVQEIGFLQPSSDRNVM